MTNVDVGGISRGGCGECECREFVAGERVRCAACGHVPNKHSVASDDAAKDIHTIPRTQSVPKDFNTRDSIRSLTNATFDLNLMDTNSSINANPFRDNLPPPASPNLPQLDTGHEPGTNATFFASIDTNPFRDIFPPPVSQLDTVDTGHQPAVSGESRNTDSRGVSRGPCSQCECEMYQRPTLGVKCLSCAHPPIRHSTGHTPSSLQLSEPCDLLNRFETPSHSKVSAKVDISSLSITAPSHQVMTSFRSDPPGVISVSADNSLIVPADQPVKITIEINVIPTSK